MSLLPMVSRASGDSHPADHQSEQSNSGVPQLGFLQLTNLLDAHISLMYEFCDRDEDVLRLAGASSDNLTRN